MVWLECLRLYPPVTLFVSRETSENFPLDDGTVIEKGTIVQAPVFQIQRDPILFPEPDKFDPERFDPELRKGMHPMSFLAFGAGPRVCLGSSLATYEGKIIAKNILSRYRITPVTQGDIQIISSTVFIHPKGKVPLRFTPLNPSDPVILDP